MTYLFTSSPTHITLPSIHYLLAFPPSLSLSLSLNFSFSFSYSFSFFCFHFLNFSLNKFVIQRREAGERVRREE